MEATFTKRPLSGREIKGSFSLSNGMYCVYGSNSTGVGVDVYADEERKDLRAMHRDINLSSFAVNEDILKHQMENMFAVV